MDNGANKAIRERFFANLHNDWALPGLLDRVQANALRQKPAPRIDMTIAVIGGERLNIALADVLDVVALSNSDWRAQIENKRPAFLLVESNWLAPGDPWRDILIGSGGGETINKITDYCREQNIPTAFWFNRDAPHLDAYKAAMAYFDHVFAHEFVIDDVKAVRADASPLRAYVDTGCFNPYKHKAGDWSKLDKVTSLLMARVFDYANVRSSSGLSEALKPLFDQNFWFYEDRFNIRNNNQRMTPVERCRVLGCFHHEDRASLLKCATAEILAEAIFPKRSPQVEQHILECFATKTLCISGEAFWQERFSAGMRSVGASGYRDAWLDVRANPIDAAIAAHQAWRQVMQSHTYFEFVEDICSVICVPVAYSVPKKARLSFILPTIRPELVPMSIEFYKAQEYDNRELLIVLNADGVDTANIERAIGDDKSIKLLKTPADMPVGCAVNFGVLHMTGDYWAKMDDDDYYSPTYLTDIDLYRKSVDFDIAGKGALFNYLEAEDKTIMRSWRQADRESHNFAGGTLVVKNAPDNVHWPENVRGFADIEFLTKRLVEGAHIASLDPFGHIQIRRGDSRFHTWTKQAVHANSAFESDGLNVESAFV